MRQIRRALSDTEPWRGIETMPRRGYRLRLDALAHHAPPASRATAPSSAPVPLPAMRGTRRTLAWVAVAAVVVAVVTLIERGPNQHHAVAMAVARAVHDAVF